MEVIANALGKITRDEYKKIEPGLLVSECRHGSSTSPASLETRRIPDDQLDEFFRRCGNPALDRGVGSIVVWVPLRLPADGRKITRDIDEELLNRVIHNFNLGKTVDLADCLYYHICTTFRSVSANGETDVFVIKGPHEWGTLAWAFDKKQRTSRGLYIIREDSMTEAQRLLGSLVRCDQEPLFFGLLPLLFTIKYMLGNDIDQIQRSTAAIESRTGYRHAAHLWAPKAEGDLASLSAITSGNAVELARARQASGCLKNQLDLFDGYERSRAEREHILGFSDGPRSGAEEIAQCLAIARDCMRAADVRLTLLRDRSDIQLTALFHLTAQQETQASIELAKESKAIAEASKSDSSAMRSLAAVTIVFLPGTSIASLFAMPFFQQDANGKVQVNSQFWWYWAIVLPLTTTLLLAWAAWIRREKLMRKYQKRRERPKLSDKIE